MLFFRDNEDCVHYGIHADRFVETISAQSETNKSAREESDVEEMVYSAVDCFTVLNLANNSHDLETIIFFRFWSYLHHFDPPVIHRELTSDAIFIQQNGLIKIGSIAPDIVHQHVKTRDNQNWSKALQYMAPELLNSETAQKHHYGTPVDIYSFGIIALETFNVEFGGNGDSHHVHSVDDALSSLEKDQQVSAFFRFLMRISRGFFVS